MRDILDSQVDRILDKKKTILARPLHGMFTF